MVVMLATILQGHRTVLSGSPATEGDPLYGRRGGRGAYATLPRDQRMDLLADVCRVVTGMIDTEIRLFTVIIEKSSWFARYPGRSHHEMYVDAFEELVSRFDLYLRRRNAEGQPSKGLMTAGPHTTGLTGALKAELARFQTEGTRWANVYNVVETVLFLDSHESPGLQMADLCSYAVWRLVEYCDDRFAKQLAMAFDREPLTGARTPGKWHGIKIHRIQPRHKRLPFATSGRGSRSQTDPLPTSAVTSLRDASTSGTGAPYMREECGDERDGCTGKRDGRNPHA